MAKCKHYKHKKGEKDDTINCKDVSELQRAVLLAREYKHDVKNGKEYYWKLGGETELAAVKELLQTTNEDKNVVSDTVSCIHFPNRSGDDDDKVSCKGVSGSTKEILKARGYTCNVKDNNEYCWKLGGVTELKEVKTLLKIK